ncbi:MAG TPA: ABC transporter substrate-binding protein [Candidatus Negativibacillus faecipullorum]|nr:ABC transporter substrate-binding protein [Candidatus Negativibacillus faecipullorum]
MRKLLALLLAFTLLFSFNGCGQKQSGTQELDLSSAEWDEIVEAARGTTVTFYGWGGDENRNNWLNTTVADYVKEHYDIALEVVGMDINDILSKLSGEKQAGSETGSIDMIWINGENFYSAKDNGLLYGPFTGQLPNMEAYIDLQDPETLNDFCMPIEGYEAPYAKAQMVFFNDSAVTPEAPASAEELLEFCKKYPGKVTYPALPDFTGSAFVRNIIYELCGWEQFQDMEADYDTVKAAIEPALDYLRELNPYLWNEGKTFPESSTTVDAMFADGELVMNMSYGPFSVATGIAEGTYTDTTRTFVFDNGTIGNTNYMAIAFNSPNKAGAMVVINAILSAELQLTQYEQLRELPVVSADKLSAEEQAAFDAVDLGKGVLSQAELLKHRLPEMPADLVPVIEEIWLNEVVGK